MHNNGGRRGLNHSLSTGQWGGARRRGWKHDRRIFFSCRLMVLYTGCLTEISRVRFQKKIMAMEVNAKGSSNKLISARMHQVLLTAGRGNLNRRGKWPRFDGPAGVAELEYCKPPPNVQHAKLQSSRVAQSILNISRVWLTHQNPFPCLNSTASAIS